MSERVRVCLLLFALLLVGAPAAAHEVRPAYLEIREQSHTSYDVVWKRPARADGVLKIVPVFPADCRQVSVSTHLALGALTSRASLECERTLSGRAIEIDGLSATMVDALVSVQLLSGDEQSLLLRGGNTKFEVAARPTRGAVFRSYVGLGFQHILGGLDHLLFVLGLLLVVRGTKRLLFAITCFTLAHSVTLGLSSLSVIRIPGPPVEIVIALSIVLLASEVVASRKDPTSPTWTAAHPGLVTFSVGLLHGLGFAGALHEVGLPASEVPLGLLAFNLGVELGQMAFVMVMLGVGRLLLRTAKLFPAPEKLQRRTLIATGYGLGVLASFWVFDRLSALA